MSQTGLACTRPRGAEVGGELSSLEWTNTRLMGEVRLALIVAVLLLLFLCPADAGLLSLGIIAAYAAFSVTLSRLVAQRKAEAELKIAPWVDAAAYGLLVALNGALQSPFVVFLLFPALAVAFQRGARRGMGLAMISMLWLAAITLFQGLTQPAYANNHLSLGAMVSIATVALVIARCAIFEASTVRHLAFSRDLNNLFAPGNRLDCAVYELAEVLRSCFEADAAVMVVNDPKSKQGWLLYRAQAADTGKSLCAKPIDSARARPLLALPDDLAVSYRARRFFWQRRACEAVDIPHFMPRALDRGQLDALANALETRSFASVPLRSRNQTVGRLYLSSKSERYTTSQLRFLEQATRQVGLMIENMQLVEQLTVEVASRERKKISRDLHDGTIQPYIGLKLGLEALHRQVRADALVAREVEELIKIAADGIDQLRNYVGDLKRSESDGRRESLLPAVRREAMKFSEYYGIEARVAGDGDITVSGRLLEEILFIVREGLSNIRRHSESRYADLNLQARERCLRLEFVNENGCDGKASSDVFFPRSMGERARELGGRLDVQRRSGGETSVMVEIPV